MEDALVQIRVEETKDHKGVLILVVMEDALVLRFQVAQNLIYKS